MKHLCVFCGSASGNSNQYTAQAKNLGELLAQKNIALVYGGSNIGVMGALAHSVLENSGTVVGVIPKNLVSYEIANYKATKLHIVEDMHERKRMMYDFADAFLVLPGGMGTLDEMFEILTWSQLKLHSKPVYILNEFNFYDSLLNYLQHSYQEGFIKEEHMTLIKVIKNLAELETEVLSSLS